MIRLNRIFGRRGPDGLEPTETATAPHEPGFDPTAIEEDWDEGLADDYLTQQEKTGSTPLDDLMVAPPAPIVPAVIPIPQPDLAPELPVSQRQWAARQLAGQVLPEPAVPIDLSQTDLPDTGRAGRRAGRVKTRLLGFDHAPGLTQDPIEAAIAATPVRQDRFPTGWIVVIHGPGRGAFFPIFNGVSQIGRGDDQAIRLDFGDNSISRSNHAAIAYDDEQNRFFLGHGGKTNIVRLNDRPVISTEPLQHHDLIRIGESTLMFVALCAGDFNWGAALDGSDHGG